MNTRNILFFLFILSVRITTAQSTINGSIHSGGVIRTYMLYVPASYSPSKPAPLVFNFHGYSSNNSQQIAYGEFRPIADTAGFLEVLPMGLVTGGNAGFSNFGSVASASVDIDFTSNLIDTLKTLYNINLNRVYSTGMSNGGFMSYDLACFLSTRFAAIASVSGSMVAAHFTACNPGRPVPVMEIHGTTDPTVSYNGTGGILASTDIDTLVKYWVNHDHCNPVPVFTAVPNVNTADNCTAEHYVYNNGNSASTVEFFKIIGGGHAWPGSIYPTSNGNTNEDFNASAEIWRFFNRYSLNTLTGIEALPSEQLSFNLYPNPSSGIFTLTTEKYPNASFRILNTLGETVLEEKIIAPMTVVELSKCAAGLYIIEFKSDDRILCRKFIKQ
jgi:polyhydroxybutyrate depolymerase